MTYKYLSHRLIQFCIDSECSELALVDNCTSSSDANSGWDCHKVYSGPEDREWEIRGSDNMSPWIKLILKNEYYLHQLMVKPSTNPDNRFSQIDIEFSNGTSIRKLDLANQEDWIPIVPPNGTLSRYVKIIRRKSRGPTERGAIAKIRVFGCLPGTLS